MQKDFHYYATYCAAYIAGYSHEESLAICYSAQLVDWCSRTYLKIIGGPLNAATTQLQLELMEAGTDALAIQDITRIWASFHFLPGDLYAERKGTGKRYLNKYRLICQPNSELLVGTVELASESSLQAAGLAMHVLADTWAHRNFAGTPSLAINNTNYYFYEILPDGSERTVTLHNNPQEGDDIEKSRYVGSLFHHNENSVMNLGHGRAGHLPDYSFMRYRYLPAWGDYEEIIKDNPDDYIHAFCQMIYALEYLRGSRDSFEKNSYAWEAIEPWKEEIREILERRQLDACQDWKDLGQRLSGCEIPDFDLNLYQEEYMAATPKERKNTFLGKFILAALLQKRMVTNKIFRSGNWLAGVSIDQNSKGFTGIRNFAKLMKRAEKEMRR